MACDAAGHTVADRSVPVTRVRDRRRPFPSGFPGRRAHRLAVDHGFLPVRETAIRHGRPDLRVAVALPWAYPRTWSGVGRARVAARLPVGGLEVRQPDSGTEALHAVSRKYRPGSGH